LGSPKPAQKWFSSRLSTNSAALNFINKKKQDFISMVSHWEIGSNNGFRLLLVSTEAHEDVQEVHLYAIDSSSQKAVNEKTKSK